MPDILIRGLDEETVERLKLHAKNHDRSLQAEVSEILKDAAKRRTPEELHAMFEQRRRAMAGRKLPCAVELVREDRDR